MIIPPNTSQGHIYEAFRYSRCNRIVPMYLFSVVDSLYYNNRRTTHYAWQKYWLVRQALTKFFFLNIQQLNIILGLIICAVKTNHNVALYNISACRSSVLLRSYGSRQTIRIAVCSIHTVTQTFISAFKFQSYLYY